MRASSPWSAAVLLLGSALGCARSDDERVARALPASVLWAGDSVSRLGSAPEEADPGWFREAWRAASSATSGDAGRFRRRARLSIVAGRRDEAISDLERALSLAPHQRELRFDLAAARIERGLEAQRAGDLVLALHLIADLPPSRESECNRAIASAALHLREEARAAWISCGRPEVSERREALPKPSLELARALAERGGVELVASEVARRPDTWRRLFETAEAWEAWRTAARSGDREVPRLLRVIATALSERVGDRFALEALSALELSDGSAIALIDELCRAFSERDAGRAIEARRRFAGLSERLAPWNPPLASLAELESAVSIWPEVRGGAARTRLRGLTERFERDRLPGLAARAAWYEGLGAQEAGRFEQARAAFERARDSYASRQESESTAALESLLSATAGSVGDFELAWSHRMSALGRIDELGSLERLRSHFWGAAWLALNSGATKAAPAFAREWQARDRPSQSDEERQEEAAFLGHVSLRADRDEEAARWLAVANDLCAKLADPADAARACATASLFSGELAIRRDPARATPLLEAALERHREQGYGFLATQTLALLATSELRAGRIDDAIGYLEAAFTEQLHRGRESGSAASAARLSDLALESRDALATTLFRERREPWRALAWMDRAGGWLESRRDGSAIVERGIDALPPPGVAVLVLHPLAESTLAWVATSRQRRALELAVSERALGTLIDLVQSERGDAVATSERARAELSELLFAPFRGELNEATSLRIVATGRLSELEWAVLDAPRADGTLLGESHEIEIRLSAADALDPRPAGRLAMAPERAVVVGDPAFDPDLEPALARLPGAAAEAREVAGELESARLLVGAEARRTVVVEALRGAELIHLAAHAVGDPEHPLAARLLLAPDGPGEDGSLSAEVLAELDLRGVRLAVLSACSSGRGYSSRSSGQLSLARALLASGVEQVVAATRPIEDRLATEFVRSFYRHLIETGEVGAALGRAQAEARARLDLGRDRREVWSAFQLYARAAATPGAEKGTGRPSMDAAQGGEP